MPCILKKSGDVIALKMQGLSDDEFQNALAAVRAISARRWNGTDKVWEFPSDPLIAQRLIQTVRPNMTADVQKWLQAELAAQAEAVATKLPDDADLNLPGADVLYPYQRAGIEFLVEHPCSILADDMGLGKTVQSIGAVMEKKRRIVGAHDVGSEFPDDDPILVVCPNTVIRNWRKEIKFWVPKLAARDPETIEVPVFIIDGSKAKREKTLKQALRTHNAWIIVNWEKLRIMPELGKVSWTAIIADEAHRAKNRKAQQTKALWKLQSPMKLALTGTPIQNSPDEIWAVLKWLYPKQYTGYWKFFENYVDYYEGHWGRVITGVRNADNLRFELSDKLARRTKGSVLDLPEKVRVVIPVELKPKQRVLYDKVEEEFWVEIDQAAAEGDESAMRIQDAAARGQSLMSIPNAAARCTRMRQVASTPALLGAEDESAKLDTAVELIEDADPSKQFVVFCHFKGTAEILVERLTKKKITADRITGEIGMDRRQENVEAFQKGSIRVLVCTIAAGGVGLTLTAADTAIFIERDWVPANNEQAEDRLHRIGQKNAVTVYILEAEDTVDTGKIAPALLKKRAVVSSVIETDVVAERAATINVVD
jgi:SNF2 family DNA or RNA helicase